jgi:D-xylulose 5-phosphate/D-fructose 6-phosphate phosphoketolase
MSIESPADLRAFGKARATIEGSPRTAEEVSKMDGYRRASLYLNLGMLSWRAPISSLNLLIASSVWLQNHKGFTDQAPAPAKERFPNRADCLLQSSSGARHQKARDPRLETPFEMVTDLEQTPGTLQSQNANTRN